MLYRPNLPGFEEKESNSSSKSDEEEKPTLTQRDSELLISFLTVPYMRLPLVLTFFSTNDRVHKLESSTLQEILDGVLFEPGPHLRLDLIGVAPTTIPCDDPSILASPFGALVNELCFSPEATTDAVIRLLEGALALDTGSVTDPTGRHFNPGVKIILYAARAAARIDNYLTFLIDYNDGDQSQLEMRGAQLTKATAAALKEARRSIRNILFGRYLTVINIYLQLTDDDINTYTASDSVSAEKLSDKVRMACDLHVHKLLLFRNVQPGSESVDVEAEVNGPLARSRPGTAASTSSTHSKSINDNNDTDVRLDIRTVYKNILGSFVFLTTRYVFQGNLSVPDPQIYEVLTVHRRALIKWCQKQGQHKLDDVMQTSLDISSSMAGAYLTEPKDHQNRWSKIEGARSVGRFVVASTRTHAAGPISAPLRRNSKPAEDEVQTVAATVAAGVELDIQIGQMTLRNRHLKPLPEQIKEHPDVKRTFGSGGTIQASQLSETTNCLEFRLVSLKHDVAFWSPHEKLPPRPGTNN